MENILKEQFTNATLILCEFEKDFNNESGNLEEIHDILQTVVNRCRDIMADYCFEQYNTLEEICEDEFEIAINIWEQFVNYYDTIYLPYIESIFDIVVETLNEIKDVC